MWQVGQFLLAAAALAHFAGDDEEVGRISRFNMNTDEYRVPEIAVLLVLPYSASKDAQRWRRTNSTQTILTTS